MEVLLVLGLAVVMEVLVCVKTVAVVMLVVGEEVSDGDNGDLVGVGNAGASADACDNGGGVGDDGGSHFGVDCEGCVVGDAFRVAGVGVGNNGVGVGVDDGNKW